MKLILINQRYGHSRTIVIKGWLKGLLSLCLLGAPIALGYLGYQLALSHHHEAIASQKADLQPDEQVRQLSQLRRNAEQQLEALTARLATLQARLLRLDALGERLTALADLDPQEFNFGQEPVAGGLLLNQPGLSLEVPDFIGAIRQLELEIAQRDESLEAVGDVIDSRQLEEAATISGRPIADGWMSSGFGRRVDPFTGHMAWHNGVDFASQTGGDILSVGAGVVTHAGTKAGYGLSVEVDHGNGYLTRYAHASELLVEPGDIVAQGETIALVGNTGRSTGPHLHFEVYKNGRVVDPASYIRRTHR